MPLLSEQGHRVINCDKKYCEHLRTLQRYSLGKGGPRNMKKLCEMAVKFQTSLRSGMFK